MTDLKCSKCQEYKPTSEFHENKSTSRKYSYYCKDCRHKYSGHKQRRNFNHSDGTRTCPKCSDTFPATSEYFTGNSNGLTWCHECNRKHFREWRKNNPEKKKDVDRRYARKNKKKLRHYHKQYYLENKAHIKEKVKRWVKENPERMRMNARATQARRRNRLDGEPEITGELIQEMYDLQGGKCLYCEMDLYNEYHVDHIIPVAKGGGNSFDNLCIACPPCNQSKADMLITEWKGFQDD